MSRPHKKVEPCYHWAVTFMDRACEECLRYFDKDADAQADRDAHNSAVIRHYRAGKLPGMGHDTGDLS